MVSTNPGRSRQAQIASLVRRALAAEAAGEAAQAISLLREAARLDPGDRRTPHRIGELFRVRLERPAEAAPWYAKAARAQEREGLPHRAIAEWRLVLACRPLHVEAHERIAALYAAAGRLADARLQSERSERTLREAGLFREAAILQAQREALEDAPPATPSRRAAPAPPAPPAPEAGAGDETEAHRLAAERRSNGRVYRHFGLFAEARRHLEEVVAAFPRHLEALRLLADVCREMGDAPAASGHLDRFVHLMRSAGTAAPADPLAEVLEESRADLERLIDRLGRRKGGA
jgi:tetratricopeptide (TPR) repeat protein